MYRERVTLSLGEYFETVGVYELSATIVFTAELGSVVWRTGFKGPVGLAPAVKGNSNIRSSFPFETGFTLRP